MDRPAPPHAAFPVQPPDSPEYLVASTSWIEVDLPAISANVRVVRDVLASRIAGSTSGGKGTAAQKPAICAVMKADGYGLGAARVAKRLQLAGVEMLAVYSPEQARALVDAAITSPILMLMPLHDLDRGDVLYRAASRAQLHLTIHDSATLDAAVTITERLGLRLAVQLEVDTGMSRGGASLEEAGVLLKRIIAHPRLVLTGVFNHFSSADASRDETRTQSDAFTKWISQQRRLIPDDAVVHEANTFGTFRSSGYHRSMVRLGLALIGFAGEDFGDSADFEFEAEAARLTPAVRWMSQIVHVKSIEPGTPVGYGATWRAARPTRVGLVPVGYADGYPLSLSNNAHVGVMLRDGMKAFVPLIGRVSMDQITVDLTDVPEGQVVIGSLVEVIGNDRSAPNHLPTLAKRAGTIGHEMLCRLSPRLTRQYLAVEKPTSVGAITGTVAV
jgi:alanine racemase